MATAKITLIGFYQWMKINNDDLFANLSVPSGIDKNKLINTILMNGAEFEVVYGDADYFKFLIGPWSDKWYRTMDRWAKALAIDYAPLENYDRQEEWNDTGNSVRSNTKTASDSRNENDNTITSANSTSSGTGSTENKKSAYDSSTYSPYEKAETGSSGSNTSNGVEAASKNASGTMNESGNEINSNNNVRNGYVHGNIGVKTSQSMLGEEIDISRFNLYDEIAALFLTEFCIYTY